MREKENKLHLTLWEKEKENNFCFGSAVLTTIKTTRLVTREETSVLIFLVTNYFGTWPVARSSIMKNPTHHCYLCDDEIREKCEDFHLFEAEKTHCFIFLLCKWSLVMWSAYMGKLQLVENKDDNLCLVWTSREEFKWERKKTSSAFGCSTESKTV